MKYHFCHKKDIDSDKYKAICNILRLKPIYDRKKWEGVKLIQCLAELANQNQDKPLKIILDSKSYEIAISGLASLPPTTTTSPPTTTTSPPTTTTTTTSPTTTTTSPPTTTTTTTSSPTTGTTTTTSSPTTGATTIQPNSVIRLNDTATPSSGISVVRSALSTCTVTSAKINVRYPSGVTVDYKNFNSFSHSYKGAFDVCVTSTNKNLNKLHFYATHIIYVGNIYLHEFINFIEDPLERYGVNPNIKIRDLDSDGKVISSGIIWL